MERARTIDIIFAQERILARQFLIMVASEQGNARSGDLPRAPPLPRCAQISRGDLPEIGWFSSTGGA